MEAARVLEYLLHGGQKPDVNQKIYHDGKIAIHFAGSAYQARLLIAGGANVDAQDHFGNTPLHVVCGGEGQIWLDSHSLSRQADIVELLLAAGADPNIQDNRGKTALHILRQESLGSGLEIVRMLVAAGADVNIQDNEGKTPLHVFREEQVANEEDEEDSTEITSLLIDNGADVHVKDDYGNPPLFTAENLDVVKLLLAAGADINPHENRQLTLLHIIVAPWRHGRHSWCTKTQVLEAVRFLISVGADVNARDCCDKTPLQYVTEIEMARILIDAGSRVNPQNFEECDLRCAEPGVFEFIQSHYARVIQKGCQNWLWKPVCKDGKPGIHPKLLMDHVNSI